MVVRVLHLCGWLFAGSVCISSTSSTAQNLQAATVCASDRAEIDRLSKEVAGTPVWNDAQIAKARQTLATLKASQQRIAGLGRRLQGLQQSAVTSDYFDRSAEARVWSRDARDLQDQINAEVRKAKTLAALVGVHCPGCPLSMLVAQVQKRVEAAGQAPSIVARDQQLLTVYQQNMAGWRCSNMSAPASSQH